MNNFRLSSLKTVVNRIVLRLPANDVDFLIEDFQRKCSGRFFTRTASRTCSPQIPVNLREQCSKHTYTHTEPQCGSAYGSALELTDPNICFELLSLWKIELYLYSIVWLSEFAWNGRVWDKHFLPIFSAFGVRLTNVPLLNHPKKWNPRKFFFVWKISKSSVSPWYQIKLFKTIQPYQCSKIFVLNKLMDSNHSQAMIASKPEKVFFIWIFRW